jgi:hypothetical protein
MTKTRNFCAPYASEEEAITAAIKDLRRTGRAMFPMGLRSTKPYSLPSVKKPKKKAQKKAQKKACCHSCHKGGICKSSKLGKLLRKR